MTTPPRDSLLVVRVWLEPHREPGFRARLMLGDLTHPVSTRTVTSPDAVLDAVRTWLAEYLGRCP